MNILVLGGTRFFGVPMVKALLNNGHQVTIATRGRAKDDFGENVKRIVLERTDAESMHSALHGKHYDVVIDKLAYCSEDVRIAMETLDCNRYIQMSSTAVYMPLQMDTREEDFDGHGGKQVWCTRGDFPYDEVKRQAEYALWQVYGDQNWVAVRYPFVIGKDDYTNRLRFYVEHTMRGIPMHIDNIDAQMGFIRSDEAGAFIAYLAEQDFSGAINGCAAGTISLREIISYVEVKTGKKAILSETGEAAPYNGTKDYSVNTELAEKLGFRFSNLKDWIFDLLDYYMDQVNMK